VNWRDTPDGRHCDRHDRPLKRGEVCMACVTEPVKVDDRASAVSDAGLLEREAGFISDSKLLRRHARELISDGTAQDRRDAYKAFDTAIKYERIAMEIRNAVSQRDLVREGLGELNELHGKRGRH
jgi:hypothetical protein